MFDSKPTDHWAVLDLKDQLTQLQAERAFALLHGLSADTPYVADIDDDLAAARHAYIAAAVTELATLRAELFGPQVG